MGAGIVYPPRPMSSTGATTGAANGAPLARPPIAALICGVVVLGALSAWQPIVALGLALLAVVVFAIRDIPVKRMAPALVIVAAIAAIGGPNLAAPGAGEVFLFRIVIVLLGLGTAAYLAMDGPLPLPAGLPRPGAILVTWFSWTVVSIGWAESIGAAIRWTSFMAMMAGLAIGIALLCRNRRRTLILLWALCATFAAACAIALAEVATGMHLPTFRSGRESTQGLIGVGSLFGNQNNFATFLSLSLPYFATLPLIFRDVRLRAVGVAGSLACLGFILLTGSKSGLASAGLVLGAMLVMAATDRQARRRILGAVVVAGLALAVVLPSLSGGGLIQLDERTVAKLDFGNLITQIETGQGSGAVRAGLLGDGLHLVNATDGLGVGPGNAETRIHNLGPVSPQVANVHNWWLEVLVNGGIVGFSLYLLFYVTLVRRQAKVWKSSQSALARYMAISGALALIGWIVGSIGPSTAIHFAPMWIVFGLGMGALVRARQEAPPSAS